MVELTTVMLWIVYLFFAMGTSVRLSTYSVELFPTSMRSSASGLGGLIDRQNRGTYADILLLCRYGRYASFFVLRVLSADFQTLRMRNAPQSASRHIRRYPRPFRRGRDRSDQAPISS